MENKSNNQIESSNYEENLSFEQLLSEYSKNTELILMHKIERDINAVYLGADSDVVKDYDNHLINLSKMLDVVWDKIQHLVDNSSIQKQNIKTWRDGVVSVNDKHNNDMTREQRIRMLGYVLIGYKPTCYYDILDISRYYLADISHFISDELSDEEIITQERKESLIQLQMKINTTRDFLQSLYQ